MSADKISFPDFTVLTKLSVDDVMALDYSEEAYQKQYDQQQQILAKLGFDFDYPYIWSYLDPPLDTVSLFKDTIEGAVQRLATKEGADLVYFNKMSRIGFVGYYNDKLTGLCCIGLDITDSDIAELDQDSDANADDDAVDGVDEEDLDMVKEAIVEEIATGKPMQLYIWNDGSPATKEQAMHPELLFGYCITTTETHLKTCACCGKEYTVEESVTVHAATGFFGESMKENGMLQSIHDAGFIIKEICEYI